MVVAAGLLSKVYAQSTSTVYSDVYLATTTIVAECSSCTTDAVPQSYTVIVPDGTTTLVGSGAPASATAASSASSCGFSLAVDGSSTLGQISDGQIQATTLGQISDGQIQAASNLATSTFTLSNGMIYDQAGRICSISGQNQSQFQCNYVPTTGSTTTTFSLSGSDLAFNGNTTFYACLLGGANDGYNIYQTLTGNQSNCTAISLEAQGATDCYTDDDDDDSEASATASPAATSPAYVGSPVYFTASPASALPAATTTALPVSSGTTSVPISTGAGSSLKSPSLAALLVAAGVVFFKS